MAFKINQFKIFKDLGLTGSEITVFTKAELHLKIDYNYYYFLNVLVSIEDNHKAQECFKKLLEKENPGISMEKINISTLRIRIVCPRLRPQKHTRLYEIMVNNGVNEDSSSMIILFSDFLELLKTYYNYISEIDIAQTTIETIKGTDNISYITPSINIKY